MLYSRNLDDQTFEEIMDFIINRLPWLCPAWTDYNAHDPGITILELIAWYKEMQQYHMNVVTDQLRKKLLKLVGVIPMPAQAATCFIDLPNTSSYPARARLETEEDIPFELLEAAQGGAILKAAYVVAQGQATNVFDILQQPQISIKPFDYDDTGTELLLGLDDIATSELRIWFEIDDECHVSRNAFEDALLPRGVNFELVGTVASPRCDDTHALSQSGYVYLPTEGWAKTDVGLGLPTLHYLRISLHDPGCEETVRIRSVHTNRHRIVQQQTWSHMSRLRIDAAENAFVTLADEVSLTGCLFAFIREKDALRQAPILEEIFGEGGRTIAVDSRAAVQDGESNLLVVSADQFHVADLFFDASGLPNMRLAFPLGGRKIIYESMALICDTRHAGGVRPAVWRYVDDLSICAPNDRVFTVDTLREELVFGDGEHGCIVPCGKNAILVAAMVLSYCTGGNIPSGALTFVSDGMTVCNTAARGGRDAQSVSAAAQTFLKRLEAPQKCASARDYERAALSTPGLRVAAAKAIVGYDPKEPTGKSAVPCVSVVVIPYSGKERPLPDARFLGAIHAHINRLRPICTDINIIAPRYVPIGLYVQARIESNQSIQLLRAAASEYFSLSEQRGIGDGVIKNDLEALLLKIDGVLKIERLEISKLGPDCTVNAAGDIFVPPNAVAYLKTLDIDVR